MLLGKLTKKILELNPSHPILTRLAHVDNTDDRSKLVIEQLYENVLLIEGLHQDLTSMTSRIHALIEKALNQKKQMGKQPSGKADRLFPHASKLRLTGEVGQVHLA